MAIEFTKDVPCCPSSIADYGYLVPLACGATKTSCLMMLTTVVGGAAVAFCSFFLIGVFFFFLGLVFF